MTVATLLRGSPDGEGKGRRLKIAAMKDFGVGGAVRAWTQITAFATVVVAGRVLSREEFGIYAVAAVFTTLISTVLYSGLYEYIIKSDDNPASDDTCFWMNCAIALAGAAVMAAAAPITAHAVGAPQLQSVMWLLAPSSFIPALTSWQEALVLRKGKISVYYYVWFFAETLSAGLTVLLFYLGFRIEALIGYRYSLGLLTAAGYLTYATRLPHLVLRLDAAKSAWTFASRLFGSRLIGIVGNYGADLIIGIFAGPAQAGAYRLANRLVFGVGEIWLQPIKTIAWVKFSAASRNGAGFGREWIGLMTVLSLIAWPALGGAAVLATQLTGVLFGGEWDVVAPVIMVLALAKSFELFEVFLDPLLTLSDRAKWLIRIRFAACCGALAGFMAVAKFGAEPAAWVQAGIYIALGGIAVWFGIVVTRLNAKAVAGVLGPGLVATAATMGAAATASYVTRQAQWDGVAGLAIDVAAGVLAWGFVVGVLYRRKAMEAVAAVQQPAPAPV